MHCSAQLVQEPHAGATVQPGCIPCVPSASSAFTGVHPATIVSSDAIANLVITFAILRSFLRRCPGRMRVTRTLKGIVHGLSI